MTLDGLIEDRWSKDLEKLNEALDIISTIPVEIVQFSFNKLNEHAIKTAFKARILSEELEKRKQ